MDRAQRTLHYSLLVFWKLFDVQMTILLRKRHRSPMCWKNRTLGLHLRVYTAVNTPLIFGDVTYTLGATSGIGGLEYVTRDATMCGCITLWPPDPI
jgi:hypothetical protein